MKTKAYKLAAELGLQERPVLDWLKSHGYPNARRADTIRADVAQAARRALGRGRPPARGSRGAQPQQPPRQGHAPQPPRPAQNTGRAPTGRPQTGRQATGRPQTGRAQTGRPQTSRPTGRQTQNIDQRQRQNPGGSDQGPRDGHGFRVSFADLLESHLPADVTSAKSANPMVTSPNLPVHRVGAELGAQLGQATKRPTGGLSAEQTLRLQLRRTETDRDQAQRELVILRQSLEAENRRLGEARIALGDLHAARQDLADVKAEMARVLLERATLKQSLQAAADEQATLAQTCVDLQTEVTGLNERLNVADAEHVAKEKVISDHEQAMQREMAWRKRALELERAANLGNNLSGLLQELGLEATQLQASVLRALLDRPESAASLIRSIRQVDAANIQRMVRGRMARVCTHPQCHQIALSDDRVRVEVAQADCEVCSGDPEQRWFARLVRECGRAGVRRLLVIGGADQTQRSLRSFSQGRPVDLRLISAQEDVSPARVRGRVDGCDLVVVWSAAIVPAPVSAAYADAARAEGRLVVSVLGEACSVDRFARAVCNRLARSMILAAV